MQDTARFNIMKYQNGGKSPLFLKKHAILTLFNHITLPQKQHKTL